MARIGSQTSGRVMRVPLLLILRAKQKCPESLSQLMAATLSMRRAMVYRYLASHVDLHNDAIMAGWLGVVKTLDRWDEGRGLCFSDCCRSGVSLAIRDFKYRNVQVEVRSLFSHLRQRKEGVAHQLQVGKHVVSRLS